MNPFAVSISGLTQGKSNGKETFKTVNTLVAQELLRGNFGVDGASLGTGLNTVVWSAVVPRNSSWTITATVTGRGTTGGASLMVIFGVEDFAGTTTVIGGGTWTALFTQFDVAGMDAQLLLSGNTVTLEVIDDGVQPMNWRAFISCVGLV